MGGLQSGGQRQYHRPARALRLARDLAGNDEGTFHGDARPESGLLWLDRANKQGESGLYGIPPAHQVLAMGIDSLRHHGCCCRYRPLRQQDARGEPAAAGAAGGVRQVAAVTDKHRPGFGTILGQ